MTEYDAVLFDNDGMLVEPPSDEALRAAAESAFAAVGVERPDEDHLAEIIRGVTPDSLREVCSVYDPTPTSSGRPATATPRRPRSRSSGTATATATPTWRPSRRFPTTSAS